MAETPNVVPLRTLAVGSDGTVAPTGSATDPISVLSGPALLSSFTASTAAVGTGPTLLVASPLTGRKKLIIQNTGPNPIYVGPSNVTVASGLVIDATGGGDPLSLCKQEFDCTASLVLYGICNTAQTGSAITRILQLA